MPAGKHIYERDVWLLEHPALKWQQAATSATGGNNHAAALPPGRRAHSTVLYQVCSKLRNCILTYWPAVSLQRWLQLRADLWLSVIVSLHSNFPDCEAESGTLSSYGI